MRISHPEPERLVKRMFLLAYNASEVVGMGHFQAKDGVTEDQVWESVKRAENPYGGYVFGRMMKLSVKFSGEGIEISDGSPAVDYQSWCLKYPSYQALAEAAVKSLHAEATKS